MTKHTKKPDFSRSISEIVRNRVQRGHSDRIWTYLDFSDLPLQTVAAALSRLQKQGLLIRIRKGVYYSAKKTRFGQTSPQQVDIIKAVLRSKGISWIPTGLPSYNKFGITTQISPTTILAVNRSLRSLQNDRIRFRTAPYIRRSRNAERQILDAIKDFKKIPDTTPEESFKKILAIFSEKEVSYSRTVKLSKKEPPRVRALLGLIGTMLKKDQRALNALKESLNTTSHYNLGLSHIPAAKEWKIR
jgi:hypothetical protein